MKDGPFIQGKTGHLLLHPLEVPVKPGSQELATCTAYTISP